MKTFEQLLATEANDIREIVTGILAAQKRFAAAQGRPLGRGTHTKGLCVRGTFEVFDLPKTAGSPALAARLAKGLYTKPGVYPATIRFANAESTVRPDYTPDVRAMSFAVNVPAGLLGADAVRVDFSMNNATTFPINDAHTFATLMRVLEAGSKWKKLKALASLSPAEFMGIVRTGGYAKKQKKDSVRPYQSMRYWSGVPFRHGDDDAIKYSATANPTNPAGSPSQSDHMLRDELLTHLKGGAQPITFDFGLQFLDTDRMRHKGQAHDATFWCENASIEWPEAEAPFHTVGRLTLEPNSQLSPAECEAFYIDVTEHSTPESHPLGSINRARWFAERSSRQTRLGLPSAATAPMVVVDPSAQPASRDGAPLPAPAPPLGTWVGRLSLRTVLRGAMFGAIGVFALVLTGAIATSAYLHFGGGMLPEEPLAGVIYADRGWGNGLKTEDRQAYYYTPQGAGLKNLRYSWFVNLEMPLGTQRLTDPSVMRRYGFLVDDEATPLNPDRLPVGFTRHFDTTLNEELLDLTCAACHTGQIQVTRDGRPRALRVDGGQAMHAFTDAHFGQFMPTMISSMAATVTNPLKFRRFAKKVLGPTYPDGALTLHREMRTVIATFGSMAFNEKWHGLSPTEEGFGRTDALARIANTVFAENLVPMNYAVGNAPVSFPPVWNIWKFDWVQYNASVSQPMARNIGESMGVGASYALMDRYGRPLPESERFRSTANIDGLRQIELTLWKLQPPAWDEDLLGPIDRAKAEQGKKLFKDNCEQCHGPHIAPPAIKARNAPLKKDTDPEWLMRTLCVDDIGTDPNTALNFVNARVDISRTGMTAEQLRAGARRTLEEWNRRQTIYLTGEIERLRLSLNPLDAPVRADFERQLADLVPSMERTLAEIDPAALPVGAALSYLGTMIRQHAYKDRGYTQAEQDDLDGFGILDMPQVIYAYKPRPLAGIWATPPFLHNGSVPTIYDMMTPAERRPRTFQTGSHEYDPKKLGLAEVSGYWTYDTSLPGNSNRGHEFKQGYEKTDHPTNGHIGKLLSEDEKFAIIEHLKVRDDDRDGDQTPKVPVSSTASGAPCKVPPRPIK